MKENDLIFGAEYILHAAFNNYRVIPLHYSKNNIGEISNSLIKAEFLDFFGYITTFKYKLTKI